MMPDNTDLTSPSDPHFLSEAQDNIHEAVQKFDLEIDDIKNRIFASRKRVAKSLEKANIIIAKAQESNVVIRIATNFGDYKTRPNKLAYACGVPIHIVTSIFLFSDISYDIISSITDTRIENIAGQFLSRMSNRGNDISDQDKTDLLVDIIWGK